LHLLPLAGVGQGQGVSMRTAEEPTYGQQAAKKTVPKFNLYQTVTEGCVWQAGLAHFGSLFWPTPGTLKVWEIYIP
jgi:hypothetical protein